MAYGPTKDFESSSIRDRINMLQMFCLGIAFVFTVAGVCIIATEKTDNSDSISIAFYIIAGITLVNALLVLTLWVLDTDKIQVLLSGILVIHDFLVLATFVLQLSIAFVYDFDSDSYKDYLLFSGFFTILLVFALLIFDIVYVWRFLKRETPPELGGPSISSRPGPSLITRGPAPVISPSDKDDCVTNNFYYGPAPATKCGSNLSDLTALPKLNTRTNV